jgi:hypothetical protein
MWKTLEGEIRMKHNKKIFVFGILVMVLAACVTDGGNVTPPAVEATQLAADLNAVTVESATVRLTGEVYLTSGLTVPAGVTLDLTADKAKLELQNGATLTVDGTVNAKMEEHSLWKAARFRVTLSMAKMEAQAAA